MITLNNYTKSEVGSDNRKDIDAYYGRMMFAAIMRDVDAFVSHLQPIIETINGSDPDLSFLLSCMPAALERSTSSDTIISSLMNLREKHEDLDLIVAAIIR